MTKYFRCSSLVVILGIVCLLGIIDFSYCFNQVSRIWSPSITLETLSIDFGDVSATEDVRREISIKNTGRSSLILERVVLSCSSCAVIHSYTKEPIPPGKQGKIDFSLNISDKHGEVKTSFLVLSNDKNQKAVVVNVTANVLIENQ